MDIFMPMSTTARHNKLINEIEDIDDFTKTTINDLDFVQPDFMMFKNNNKIRCYMGKGQLPDQSLKKILKTQAGLEFDLRYLVI